MLTHASTSRPSRARSDASDGSTSSLQHSKRELQEASSYAAAGLSIGSYPSLRAIGEVQATEEVLSPSSAKEYYPAGSTREILAKASSSCGMPSMRGKKPWPQDVVAAAYTAKVGNVGIAGYISSCLTC